MSGADDDDLDRLQRAAQRMDDLFGMELPDAPGGVFVGGRFNVAGADRNDRVFSAGAADTDRQRAFRRCVGEMVETLSQYAHLNPRTPRLSWQPGGLSADECERLLALAQKDAVDCAWLDAIRLADGSKAAIPAALCLRDHAPSGAVLSSGCAAGPTLEAAMLSAVLELVERDAVALWWRGGRQPAKFFDSELDAMVAQLRAGTSGRRTWFLNLTTDIDLPIIAALSCELDGHGVAAGFAARPSHGAAGRAALNELLQMELGNRLVALKHERGGEAALVPTERDQLARMTMLSADHAIFQGGEPHRSDAGPAIAFAGDAVSILAARGIEVFAVELTNSDLGVPAIKAVAPLLQGQPSAVETSRLREARRRTTLDIPAVAIV